MKRTSAAANWLPSRRQARGPEGNHHEPVFADRRAFKATLKLAELPRDGSKTRIRNRCEVTGRPRAYYRKLRMSRIALRELGNLGKVPGVVKSSW